MQCSICQNIEHGEYFVPDCTHEYHVSCLRKYFLRNGCAYRCRICGAAFSPNDMWRLDDYSEHVPTMIVYCGCAGGLVAMPPSLDGNVFNCLRCDRIVFPQHQALEMPATRPTCNYHGARHLAVLFRGTGFQERGWVCIDKQTFRILFCPSDDVDRMGRADTATTISDDHAHG